MEAIGRVTARIEEIRAMATSRNAPLGAFSAHLARAQQQEQATEPGEELVESDTLSGPPIALDFAASAPYVRSVTLGGMVGVGPARVAAPLDPVDGVMTAGQLQMYLFEHQIEQRNGRLTSADLVPISGTWHGRGSLLPPAASAWETMREAAAADGIDLRAIDTYRTWESQDRAHRRHLAGEKEANVLPAGTSEHGNGLAVDITNGSIIDRGDPEWRWLDRNAARFGWHPISNEAWHWEFRGV